MLKMSNQRVMLRKKYRCGKNLSLWPLLDINYSAGTFCFCLLYSTYLFLSKACLVPLKYINIVNK